MVCVCESGDDVMVLGVLLVMVSALQDDCYSACVDEDWVSSEGSCEL